MCKVTSAFLGVMLISVVASAAGLNCTSTVAQGSKTVSILARGGNLSRMAFGPCSGPPPTCRPIEFLRNLKAEIVAAPLGSYSGDNGRQSIRVQLVSLGSMTGGASGVAQISLGVDARPMNLDISCVPAQ